MQKRFSITVSDWILNEIIGPADNRSGRIEELLIKGYMAEKEKALKIANESEKLHKAPEPLAVFDNSLMTNFNIEAIA